VIAEFGPVDQRSAVEHIENARNGSDYVLRAGHVSGTTPLIPKVPGQQPDLDAKWTRSGRAWTASDDI
jgi:hypothetical protein